MRQSRLQPSAQPLTRSHRGPRELGQQSSRSDVGSSRSGWPSRHEVIWAVGGVLERAAGGQGRPRARAPVRRVPGARARTVCLSVAFGSPGAGTAVLHPDAGETHGREHDDPIATAEHAGSAPPPSSSLSWPAPHWWCWARRLRRRRVIRHRPRVDGGSLVREPRIAVAERLARRRPRAPVSSSSRPRALRGWLSRPPLS